MQSSKSSKSIRNHNGKNIHNSCGNTNNNRSIREHIVKNLTYGQWVLVISGGKLTAPQLSEAIEIPRGTLNQWYTSGKTLRLNYLIQGVLSEQSQKD